jgi:hypothetical protein
MLTAWLCCFGCLLQTYPAVDKNGAGGVVIEPLLPCCALRPALLCLLQTCPAVEKYVERLLPAIHVPRCATLSSSFCPRMCSFVLL